MSNYQVHVSASPRWMSDDPSLPQALMYVTYTIRSSYESSDRSPSSRIFDHYSQQHFVCEPFVSTDDSLSSPFWGFITCTLDNLRSPFALDRLRWIDPDNRGVTAEVDQAMDEVVSEIVNVACRVVTHPRNRRRKRFGILVDVTKVVTLPADQIREMGRRLLEASLRHDDQEVLQRSEAASESAIKSLEKAVVLEHCDPSEVCAICLEEVEVGEEVSRMSCSHEFHSSCIEEWLKIAHTCPTCRHKLPTL